MLWMLSPWPFVWPLHVQVVVLLVLNWSSSPWCSDLVEAGVAAMGCQLALQPAWTRFEALGKSCAVVSLVLRVVVSSLQYLLVILNPVNFI